MALSNALAALSRASRAFAKAVLLGVGCGDSGFGFGFCFGLGFFFFPFYLVHHDNQEFFLHHHSK
jgi:hypothetical protein